jgi:hypothetical protein
MKRWVVLAMAAGLWVGALWAVTRAEPQNAATIDWPDAALMATGAIVALAQEVHQRYGHRPATSREIQDAVSRIEVHGHRYSEAAQKMVGR